MQRCLEEQWMVQQMGSKEEICSAVALMEMSTSKFWLARTRE